MSNVITDKTSCDISSHTNSMGISRMLHKKIVLISLAVIFVIAVGIFVIPNLLPPSLGPFEDHHEEESWILKDSRLNRQAVITLPINLSDLVTEPHEGPIGTWGYHGGNHPEGFDHTGFVFTHTSPIYSPDDGVVAYIEERSSNDIKVIIFHNYTIASWFDHLTNVQVKVKDFVKRGQIIGYSKQYDFGRNIIDWGLVDLNNETGPIFPGFEGCPETNGSFVPPFEYLTPENKSAIYDFFNKTMMQPFMNGEFVSGMNKAEHQLINPVFPERNGDDDIAGVWILEDGNKWKTGGPPEILTFIHRNTKLFGEVFHAVYADWQGPVKFDSRDARFEINTSVTPHRIKLVFEPAGAEEEGAPLYGIYEIDTSGSRPKLKIEFSETDYPTAFSDNASIYMLRSRYHPLQEVNVPEMGLAYISMSLVNSHKDAPITELWFTVVVELRYLLPSKLPF